MMNSCATVVFDYPFGIFKFFPRYVMEKTISGGFAIIMNLRQKTATHK
jgi:hypothetical protein